MMAVVLMAPSLDAKQSWNEDKSFALGRCPSLCVWQRGRWIVTQRASSPLWICWGTLRAEGWPGYAINTSLIMCHPSLRTKKNRAHRVSTPCPRWGVRSAQSEAGKQSWASQSPPPTQPHPGTMPGLASAPAQLDGIVLLWGFFGSYHWRVVTTLVKLQVQYK